MDSGHGFFFPPRTASLALPQIRARLDYLVASWDHERTTQALGLLAGLLVVHLVSLFIYRIWFHPLSKFPGPALFSAAYLPYLYSNLVTGTFIRKIAKLHRQYGPIVRIGPNHLALDGSVAWPEVYAHRPGSKPEFGKIPGYFFPGDTASIIAAPRDVHRRQRRQLGHAFSDTALMEQEATIKRYVDMLMSHLAERADTGEAIDWVRWINFTTFDIIGDLSFSESFHCLENNGYHPWVLQIAEGVRGNALINFFKQFPLAHPIVEKLGLSSGIRKQNEVRHFAIDSAVERMKKGNEAIEGRRDFMTHMLKKNRDGGVGLHEAEVMATSPILVLAGSETTATAMSGLVFYLSQNPAVYKKLTEEIRSSFASEQDITLQSTAKLEYLHACIEEILRVYPPAAETPPRLSPGGMIAGKYVPAGTTISVFQWATFRNPDHWAEPDSFIPERWLPATHPLYDAKFKSDNHAVFKPFSFGSRDCLGKNLAYSEMRVIAARFLYGFDYEVVQGQENWHDDQCSFVTWEKLPLKIHLKQRKAV